MPFDLPNPVAAYYAAERTNDFKALAQCFSAAASVHDEGRTMRGRAEIEAWMAEAKRNYQHTTKPLSLAERDGKVVVTAEVSGSFPGSPVKLEQAFELSDDKIVSLEIG